MAYPATSFSSAVSLVITSSNQLHEVINGDSLSTILVETGEIPSLRKALVDNFYFISPIDWDLGNDETVFNQIRKFTDDTYWFAPAATVTNPITMVADPYTSSDWVIAPILGLKHNGLKGRDEADSHPSEAISYSGESVKSSLDKLNTTANTIEDLRLIEPSAAGPTIRLLQNGKEGLFFYDQNDVSTTDDTGIVIVTTGGARWKRQYSGIPKIEWFDFDLTGTVSATSLLTTVLNRYGKLTGDTDESDMLLIDSLVTVSRSVNWRFDFGLTLKCRVKNGRAMIVTGDSYISKNVYFEGGRETSEGLVTVCKRVKEYGGGYNNFYSNYDDENQADTTARQVNDCDYYRSNDQIWKDIKSDANGVAGSGGGTVRGVRFVNQIKDAKFKSPVFDTIINETDAGGFIYDDADAIVGQVSSDQYQKITVYDGTFIDCQKRCIKSQAGSESVTKIKGGSCKYTLGSISNVSVPENISNGMLTVVAIQGGSLVIEDFEFESGVIQTLFSVTDSTSSVNKVTIKNNIYKPTFSPYVATSRTKFFIISLASKIGVVVRIEHNEFRKCEIAATVEGEDVYLEHNIFEGFSSDSAVNINVLSNVFNVFNQYEGDNTTSEAGVRVLGCRYFTSFGNNYNRTRDGIVLELSLDSMPSFQGVSEADSFNSIFGDPVVNNMVTYKNNFVYWPGFTTKSFNSPLTNIAPSGGAGSSSGLFLPITCRGVQYKLNLLNNS